MAITLAAGEARELSVEMVPIVAPPPPAEMLNASQMRVVLNYVFCNQYLGTSGLEWAKTKVACIAIESYGPSAPIVLASPCGSLIGKGSAFRKECANAIAAQATTYGPLQTALANYLYYPSTSAIIAFSTLGDSIARQVGLIQEQCLKEYCHPLLWGTCFPATRYKISTGELTWAQVCPNLISTLGPQMEALWDAYNKSNRAYADSLQGQVAACCKGKIDAYKATLTAAQVKPCADYAYSQCLTAHSQIIGAYISAWGAPISIDNFLDKVRQIRGEAGVEAAIWAIENLL